MSAASPLSDGFFSPERRVQSADQSRARSSIPSGSDNLAAFPVQPAQAPKKQQIPEQGIQIGRRGAARLRLSLPAKLVSLYGSHRCILIDLSRTGGRIGLEEPLRTGETGVLQIAGFEFFCEVVRLNKGRNGGTNGVLFDPPLEDQDVLNMRAYADGYKHDDMRALRDEVRQWVNGTIDHT